RASSLLLERRGATAAIPLPDASYERGRSAPEAGWTLARHASGSGGGGHRDRPLVPPRYVVGASTRSSATSYRFTAVMLSAIAAAASLRAWSAHVSLAASDSSLSQSVIVK